MKVYLFVLMVLVLNLNYSQESSGNFKAHNNLIGGLWEVNAAWSDGTHHKLRIHYTKSLNGNILKTKTYGITSSKEKEYKLRNEGIRYLEKSTGTLKFYEFDNLGGLTEGTITYKGNNIYYSYLYKTGEQETLITDGWEYIEKNTYKYIIGVYNFENNTWNQKYLNAEIKRIN